MRNTFIILSLVVLSCNTTIPEKSNFKLIIPDTLTGSGKYILESINAFADEMNFKKLDKVVDSFELRIWNKGMIKPDIILDIRYSNKKLNAIETNFYGNDDKFPDSLWSKKLYFKIDTNIL